MTYTYLGDGTKVAAVVNLSAPASTPTDNAILEQNCYTPFGTRLRDSALKTQAANRWRYAGKEEQRIGGMDLGLLDFGARCYDPYVARWTSVDPMASSYFGINPYSYCMGNPIAFIDPHGTNPIYDINGNFLGTDDLGLQGDALFMRKENFIQGMTNKEANELNLGISSLSCEDAITRFTSSYNSLSSRPDWDGIVTPSEGRRWAKEHVGAIDSPTPENMLYIDSSHLDFGNTSISDFKDGEGSITPVNLFEFPNVLNTVRSYPYIYTTYALGYCRIKLIDSSNGKIVVINDEATDYDWNKGGRLMRRACINADRKIHGLNDSHGFKVSYYGYGYIHKN